MSKLLALPLALTVLCGPVNGGPTPTYTLRYRFRAGQVDRYNVDLTFDASSTDGSISAPAGRRGNSTTTIKVLRVRADGVAVIQAAVQGFQMLGPFGARGTDQAIIYTFSPLGTGHMVSGPRVQPGNALGALEASAATRLGVTLPLKPVKPGDTWSSTIPDPTGSKTPIKVSSRLFSVTTARDRMDVRIHQFFLLPISTTVKLPGGTPTRVSGFMSVTSAADFSPTLGKLIRNSVSGRARLHLAGTSRNGTLGDAIQVQMKTDIVVDLIQ